MSNLQFSVHTGLLCTNCATIVKELTVHSPCPNCGQPLLVYCPIVQCRKCTGEIAASGIRESNLPDYFNTQHTLPFHVNTQGN